MKFLQFKFWLVFAAMLCASCANDRITSSANKLSTNTTNSAEVTSPVGEPTATPAKRELDVPYVPTHETIVDAMLEMAEVKGADILHDLGSGDGRIPITAAKRFGTRGVGIDLNPQRVKEANENAQKAGVTDKVKFIEGDLFQHDFSEATVVTLYLLPEVNMRLRPKILEMKPGTRVVSHNYDMGDWKPEKTRTIETPDGSTHYVYFWRVPEKK
jgi:hypothetical protein